MTTRIIRVSEETYRELVLLGNYDTFDEVIKKLLISYKSK